METSEEDLDMEAVRRFLSEQKLKLESDRPTHRFEGSKIDSKKGVTFMTNPTNPPFSFNNEYRENQKMVKTRSVTRVPSSPREEEKDKLINILSQSKIQNFGTKKVTNTARASNINNNVFANDEREKEKDRLAAIFASSNYQHSKPSNHEISKNLNSLLSIKGNASQIKSGPNIEEGKSPDTIALMEDEKSLRTKYNIPEISISEYNPDPSQSDLPSARGRSMVRMGEFSPNRNHPGGPPVLGVGECDERRKIMLEQTKREFQEYSRQKAESSLQNKSPSRENHQLHDVATQTVWEGEPVGLLLKEVPLSPRPWCQSLTPGRDTTTPCVPPALHSPTVSPAQLCFGGMSEKEVKEQLYRDELKKQIEEKNRLREEKRKREEEEEAKMEAKIQQDLAKIRQQYEEERLQRMELAIRKREQEELLRQRLAFEQERSLQESLEKKKQIVKKKSVSSNQPSLSPRKRSERTVTFSPSLSPNCASQALADVHETLRQPLLEISDPQPSSSLPTTSRPASPPIHPKSSRDVDVLVRKTVFDPRLYRSAAQQTDNRENAAGVNARMQEVDRLLREPLLPQSQSFQVLPPVSPPMLHATVPPARASRSPPVPGARRSNKDILNDKWKVPYDTRQNAAADDVLTTHNRSMLTQLGAFRRHLQQERKRMQQRVADDSP